MCQNISPPRIGKNSLKHIFIQIHMQNALSVKIRANFLYIT